MKEGGAKDVKDGQNNNENEVNGDGVVLPKKIKERPIGICSQRRFFDLLTNSIQLHHLIQYQTLDVFFFVALRHEFF